MKYRGGEVISHTPLWETLGSVDNYLSSFPGVANHSKAVTGGQVDDLIVPPLLLLPPFLLLSPSSNLPFLLLSSFSFLLSTRSAGTGGTHFFPLLSFFLLLSPLAPLSLLSLLFSFFLPFLCFLLSLLLFFLPSCSSSLPLLLFLPKCSSFLLPFFPLPSEFRRLWLYSFPPPFQ